MKEKPRNILKKDWSDLRSDIERVRNELGINASQFRELRMGEWETVQRNIEEKFLFKRASHINRNWLWEDFKPEIYAVFCENDPYRLLHVLVDKDESIYFLVNETVNEQTKYWYYEGTIENIIAIIGDSVGLDEYYLASKKYDWFLCLNHHDVLIGAGDIIPKMKLNEERLKG